MDNVLLNKKASIIKCIKRIQEVYNSESLTTDYDQQDIIVLNLQRACEAAIDMGNRVIRKKELGLPQHSRDSFTILENQGYISQDLSEKMQSMVGFRNIAVHDYQRLNLVIVESIIKNHLNDFLVFCNTLIEKENPAS